MDIEKLDKKGREIGEGILGIAGLCALGAILYYALSTPSKPGYVRNAVDKLTLGYIESNIYEVVDCSAAQASDKWVFICRYPTAENGALYTLEGSPDNFRIVTINGRAMQHVAKHRAIPAVTTPDARPTDEIANALAALGL